MQNFQWSFQNRDAYYNYCRNWPFEAISYTRIYPFSPVIFFYIFYLILNFHNEYNIHTNE